MLQKEGTNSRYLDINVLELGHTYTKLALVQDVRAGVSKLDKGFYSFYVKDVNSNIVGARLFNIEKFITEGLTAKFLKGKPVSITFVAEEFRGSINLIVQEIKLYDGEFDRAQFIGKVPQALEELKFASDFLTTVIGKDVALPERFAIESINTLCGGKAGGYAKLIHLVAIGSSGYLTLPNINQVDFCFVLYKSIIHYNKYLKRLNEIDIITNKEILALLSGVKESKREELNDIVIDVLSALTGLTKPEHLYANIIYECFRTAENNLAMSELWNSMPTGFTKEVGERKLVKY